MDRDFVDACLKIEKLASKFKKGPIDTTLVRYIDITGDGIPEKVIGHVSIAKDSIFATRTIYQQNKIIFEDTKSDQLSDTTNDDPDGNGVNSVLVPLEPFASIFQAIKFIDVLNDTMVCNLSVYARDTAIKYVTIEDILDQQGVSYAIIEKQKSAFKRYAINFKGAILKSSDEDDQIPEIWYEPLHQFVQVY